MWTEPSKTGRTGFRPRGASRQRAKKQWLWWDGWQLEPRQLLATFTVVNTLDDGSPGSLRWAISQVNARSGNQVQTIDFNIPGTGPFTISPQSALPAITHPVLIDGYSQPGSHPNTLAGGENAVIMIQLSGASAGFASGLEILASGSTIRGLAINQFNKEGIRLFAGSQDTVAGNFLGTDVTGMAALPNGDSGVLVDSSNGNTVGGTTPDARNLISGNTNQNVFLIDGSSHNFVQGNWVGLTAAGNGTLFTDGNGISVFSASNNSIGGTTPGSGNVIGGQTFDGVVIDAANGNSVQGNLIGTGPTGTVALPNGLGVLIGFSNAANNKLGGTAPGAGNLISGNFGDGVLLNPALGPGNAIQGNLIGTDITGTTALPNGANGVEDSASGVLIGGTMPRAGNVISGNAQDGVLIDASFAFFLPVNDNLVQGNFIGTDATATIPLGNGADGVAIFGQFIGAMNNSIGGLANRSGNVIADNGHNGVTIGGFSFDSSTVQNSILSNSIFANGGLGIDLGDNGVTPNQSGPVFAPNNGQNYPSLLGAANFGSEAALKGALSAAPSTTYTIQFFGDPVADPSGHGQGQFLLQTASFSTDASGNLAFTQFFSSVPAGVNYLSATATDPQGNTSEFAQDVVLTSFNTPIAAFDDTYLTDINTTLTVSAPGVQANDIAANGKTFTSNIVSGPSNGSVTLNADGSFTYTPAANFVGTDSFTYQDNQSSKKSNVATVTIQVNPKTFVVTNTNDSGPGSLRQAILNANLSNSAPPDTIEFDISGPGPFLIAPLTVLPAITHPTIIDGYSQPGSSVNTLTQGDNAMIQIHLDGLSAGFTDGLLIKAGGSTVDGLAITNFFAGIHLTGAGGDTITGDFIGTDTTGLTPFEGNIVGVEVENAGNNVIGGTTPAARNVISGNQFGYGVEIFNDSTGNAILGDYIGTDATGLGALGNFYGILLIDAPSTSIGGSTPGAGNLLSGNIISGVFTTENFNANVGADNSSIEGNLIGTNATGEAPLGNGFRGLDLEGGVNQTIGGTALGAGNVISGNGSDGIGVFSPANNALIEGNLIGVDASGSSAMPNAGNGVTILASGVTVGGIAASARNVISGNSQFGITIEGSNNLVQNNLIGTDLTGLNPLGNGGDGVAITDFQAANNTIGGTADGAGNIIAFNGQTGVAVLDPFSSGLNVGNAILSNQIYGNSALGIDLGGDGVTPNHVGGLIPGPNGFENFPVLSSAQSSATSTTISGTLNAAANESFTIQFFADQTADPSGFGQGQTLIGSTTVTTDSNGNASFTVVLSIAVTPGQVVSATATDPSGNTSEFSQDVTIMPAAALAKVATRTTTSSSVDAALSSLAAAPVDDAIVESLASDLLSTRSKHSWQGN
jgi:hypothetical protein